jgi:hypothetical protein
MGGAIAVHPATSSSTRPEETLAVSRRRSDDLLIEAPITHNDVTTTMRILDDIHWDVRRIHELLEDDDGEEEEDREPDA